MKHNQALLTFTCLCLCIGILLFGLWPLNFWPKNHTRWLENEGGVQFESAGYRTPYDAGGIAFTPEPLSDTHNQRNAQKSGSIELWLTAAGEPNYCRFRIVSFQNRQGRETLFIGQWKSHLLIRYLVNKNGSQPEIRELGIRNALKKDQRRFLTITSDGTGTTLYLEGKPIKRYSGISLFSELFTFDRHRLYLGNNPDLSCPWSGIIQGMALYGYKLTASEVMSQYGQWKANRPINKTGHTGLVGYYTFDAESKPWIHNANGENNHILIPPKLEFNRPALMIPNANTLYAYDIAINIIGFIPFGFFLALMMATKPFESKRMIYLVPLAIGFLVSLSIELLQIFLPARSSSIMDLACNTLGSFIGVVAALYLMNRRDMWPPRGFR